MSATFNTPDNTATFWRDTPITVLLLRGNLSLIEFVPGRQEPWKGLPSGCRAARYLPRGRPRTTPLLPWIEKRNAPPDLGFSVPPPGFFLTFDMSLMLNVVLVLDKQGGRRSIPNAQRKTLCIRHARNHAESWWNIETRGVTNPVFAGSGSGTGTTNKGVGVGVAWNRIHPWNRLFFGFAHL